MQTLNRRKSSHFSRLRRADKIGEQQKEHRCRRMVTKSGRQDNMDRHRIRFDVFVGTQAGFSVNRETH